ncbi:RDD family protein [Streptomyces iconiensis]|uniref:RDD family protein n=1 Tax=Streptomyces iconiensis TaxID=1384038 RepID=A0ABT6ZZS8_9ACTN|nr:RDD family protein [Streptomyces iconiensis]MDJ1133903.1 RDD family protein [Streptomyces iconiensis]
MTLQSYGAQGGAAAAGFGDGGAGVAPPPSAGATIVLASRAQRFVARAVDLMLFFAGVAFIVQLGLPQIGDEWSTASGTAVVSGVAVLWVLLFPFALMRFESTIGKALVGLRVVRLRNGKRVGFWRAAWRELFHLAVSFVPVAGFLNQAWCLWDKPYRQCWHDKVSGTITVDRSTFRTRTGQAVQRVW